MVNPITFADKVLAFNRQLAFRDPLPAGIRMMNPFREDERVEALATAFYRKFYDDHRPRHLILGINPGRFGGGVTGIPFTDTKRLTGPCGIDYTGPSTHEPSSVFVYDVIAAYGGPARFYSDFFIHSICPLGFTKLGPIIPLEHPRFVMQYKRKRKQEYVDKYVLALSQAQ